MNDAPSILVFADAGPAIGGGHVMRCLTLAGALTARGCSVAFAANAFAQDVLAAFGAQGITTFALPDDPGDAAQQTGRWADLFEADWLLLDSYRLNNRQEMALRRGRRLAVIDDLADRPRPAALLLNPGYGASAQAYASLAPEDAIVLAGPRYALVRPPFAALREATLQRRQAGAADRILVSLGLTDVGAITGRAVSALLPILGDRRLDVVVGAAAPSLPDLRRLADPRVTLRVDATDMARLIAEADLAIGAGGSSVWERACLGLPGVTLVLADNQRTMARTMDAGGLTIAVEAGAADFDQALAAAVQTLGGDCRLLGAMSQRLSEQCDGQGAQRVADRFLPARPGEDGS